MHRVKYQSEQTVRKRDGVKWGPFFWPLKLSGSSAWVLHHFFPAELHLTLLTLLLSPKLIGCQSPWQPGIAQLHYWLDAIHAHLFTQQCHVHLGVSNWALWSESLHAPNCNMFISKKFAWPNSLHFQPSIITPTPTPFPSRVQQSKQGNQVVTCALPTEYVDSIHVTIWLPYLLRQQLPAFRRRLSPSPTPHREREKEKKCKKEIPV